MNDIEIVQSNEERDAIVAAYREAGLGGERYGVVCGLIDEETYERCMRRICPQGWAAAIQFNTDLNREGKVSKAGLYCLHRENYDGTEPADDITTILNTHGLPWRPLRTLRKMRENKPNKKKGTKKNVKEGQGSPQRTSNNAATGRGDNSAGNNRDAGRHGSTPEEVSGGSPTFGQFLDGKVDDAGGSAMAPRNGESRGPRLFLACREREQAEQTHDVRTTPKDSN